MRVDTCSSHGHPQLPWSDGTMMANSDSYCWSAESGLPGGSPDNSHVCFGVLVRPWPPGMTIVPVGVVSTCDTKHIPMPACKASTSPVEVVGQVLQCLVQPPWHSEGRRSPIPARLFQYPLLWDSHCHRWGWYRLYGIDGMAAGLRFPSPTL